MRSLVVAGLCIPAEYAQRSWAGLVPTLAIQKEAWTCMPVGLANAGRAIDRACDADHIVKVLQEDGLIEPGNSGIWNIDQAMARLRSYLLEAGIQAAHRPRLSVKDILDKGIGDRAVPWPLAATLTVNRAYMLQHHAHDEHLPADVFDFLENDGPGHDVLLLERTPDEVWIFDPAPNLKGCLTPLDAKSHVLRFPSVQFEAYMDQGPHGRESVRLTPAVTEPKAKDPKVRPATETTLLEVEA